MSQADENRENVYAGEGYNPQAAHADLAARMDTARGEGERDPLGWQLSRGMGSEPSGRDALLSEAQSRMVGSPLPGTPRPGSNGQIDGQAQRSPIPPGRALSTSASAGLSEDPSSMQRAMNILKQAAPFVARLLPLIDGPVSSALSNLMAPRMQSPAPVSIDLAPVQSQISDLQLQQGELRSSVQEQTASIKRVEGQLEMVREATDRNTLEQQELIGDLKNMGRKVNIIAMGLSLLLLISVLVNLVLYLHIRRVLP
jgi:hypothetical protein